MTYRKIVHVWSCNTVRAIVQSEDDREVGWQVFNVWPWRGLEATCAAAHKWADERIFVCEAWEAT